MNFTSEFYEVYNFGHLNEVYMTWSGVIGELVNKRQQLKFSNFLLVDLFRADNALGSLSVMAEREAAVDFTIPYYDLGKYFSNFRGFENS